MSFQDELNATSRTPEEVSRTLHDEEYASGAECAVLDYEGIKREMRSMANSGNYKVMPGGKHQIFMYYKSSYLGLDFQLKLTDTCVNKTFFNPKGQYARRASYVNKYPDHYEGYIEKLRELSKNDDIEVRVVGVYAQHNNLQSFDIDSEMVGFALSKHSFSVCVACRTEY